MPGEGSKFTRNYTGKVQSVMKYYDGMNDGGEEDCDVMVIMVMVMVMTAMMLSENHTMLSDDDLMSEVMPMNSMLLMMRVGI